MSLSNLMNLKRLFALSAIVILLGFSNFTSAQHAGHGDHLGLDTVKAGKFDTGRMWAFDFPPNEYFQSEYGFTPSEDWYNNVRLSALRFATYCSASFVSEDGLVMTNHHCARESITKVNKDGEDLPRDGFWAPTLEDERRVPGLFVDQLIHIENVTAQIQEAIDAGSTDEDKIKNREDKKKELVNKLKSDKGLEAQVITFYNGGYYALYGFKRYNDVRIVFAPEDQLGFFGGDPDNFTYPRYNMDCTFFRVYDDEGKPLKTKNYFKWSPAGAAAGEPVFVVGNPGSTNRLFTTAQLEFQRDYQHPSILSLLDNLVAVYSEVIAENPDRRMELENNLFSYQNSQKAYGGILCGLRNPVMMKKKQDWEGSFRAKVKANSNLESKYGRLWDEIRNGRTQMGKVYNEYVATKIRPMWFSQYFTIANSAVEMAQQLRLPKEERDAKYVTATNEKLAALYTEIDEAVQKRLLREQLKSQAKFIGKDHELIKLLTNGLTGQAAADYLLSKTVFANKDNFTKLAMEGPDALLKSGDPIVTFILKTQDRIKEYDNLFKKIQTEESGMVERLGRAVFEVYGTSIPPDATFSLRIADGVVKGYSYNGTVAPPVTTFYGMYDRFYSFGKEFPWSLPEKWINPPSEFKLETPYNFVSTNDIIGGNSGSPVINKNAEIVGLAFDGNIESLPGQFIFDMTHNRTVSVHSAGMYEAVKNLYKATRLADELKNGKIN